MSGNKGTTFDNDLLKLVFQAAAIALLADNAASTPLTNLYAALHTADPTVGNNQTSSEAAYTSYARVPIARSAAGFTVTGNSVSPAAAITFPTATGGAETETFMSIGTAASGSGKLLYVGPILPTIPVTSGVIPKISATSTVTES